MLNVLVLVTLGAAPTTKAPSKPAGPFEGTLEFRLSLQGGEGSVTTKVSSFGVHTSAKVKYLDQEKSTQVVVRASDSDVTWAWEPATNRFEKAVVPPAAKRQFTVEKKGEATVAGVPCTVVTLSSAEGVSTYCSAVGFLADTLRETLVSQAQRLAPDVEAALRSVKAYGLVVRLEQVSADGKVKTGYELAKVKREPVDRHLFDVERAP